MEGVAFEGNDNLIVSPIDIKEYRMNVRWIVSCVFVGLSTSVASAQGVIHRLPPDGTWSRYRVTAQVTEISNLRIPNAVPKEMRDSLINSMPKAGSVEGTLTISFVGSEVKGGATLHWIEIVWEVGPSKRSYRLLVPEASFKPGGDAFKEAVRFLVKRPERADGPAEEIDDPASRAAESLLVRHLFPSFPSKCEQRNIPLMVVPDAGDDTPVRGDTYRFRFAFSGKPPGGGDLASHRHEGQYFGIVSERAPFGGYRLWMTNGITVESGDCLTESRDDVTVNMTQSNMQISLIESGTGATSQFKDRKE